MPSHLHGILFDKIDCKIEKNSMNDTSSIKKLSPQQQTAARPEQPRVDVKKKGADSEPTTTQNTTERRKKFAVLVIFLIIAIVVVVVLAVLLTRDKEELETPAAVDFETGVSLVTYYGVNATITSSLARTILTVVVANALDCASIHGFTATIGGSSSVSQDKGR